MHNLRKLIDFPVQTNVYRGRIGEKATGLGIIAILDAIIPSFRRGRSLHEIHDIVKSP
jgi:hypothetical protein